MKIKNLLGTLAILSAVISSFSAYSPALAASKNSNQKPDSVSTPKPDSTSKPESNSILKPKTRFIPKPKPATSKPKNEFVNISAIEEANDYLDEVSNALSAAGKSRNKVEQDKFFEAALTTMDDANDVIEEARLSTDANAIDDFTEAIEAAQAAKNEQEEQQYLDAAQTAIDDMKAALVRARL